MTTTNLYLFDKDSPDRLQICSNPDAPFISLYIEKLNERVGCFLIKEGIHIKRSDLKELKSFVDQLLADYENGKTIH